MRESKETRRALVKTHLEDSHLVAIGHVAIRAAALDFLIGVTAKQVAVTYPEMIRKHVNGLSEPKKLSLISEVLSAELPGHKWAIAAFVSDVMDARTERNDIMHRLWKETESAEIKELLNPDKLPYRRAASRQSPCRPCPTGL